MSKAIHKVAAHPAIITVGELIDELCRLPDTAVVSFRCPMLEQQLTLYRLRKRSKDLVEVEVNAYPESPPIVPSDGAFHATKRASHASPARESALLHKGRG
ncbi:hypothetical protein GWG65_04600 [Bradyrhizobium sp. CSA207]|uniref:hypothetical protein n=1 Tax=Bradyrhizobium sp. CSA207 TaxID=2698826 RepID=UPI0023B17763|nr:hypothetical protein [Bradyrhizobium sp. CSA207]MDE5440744.1 hypothetical protein [Bradyrhizobium sp. CSA207]